MSINKKSLKVMSKKKKNEIYPKGYREYTYGPLKFEHIGRTVSVSSNWQPGEFEKYQKNIREERPNIKGTIDNKISEALSLLAQFEPLELMATVSYKNCFVDPEEYREATSKGNESYVEYAQSLVLSQKHNEALPHATEGAIDKFNNLLEEIFQHVLWYFGSEAVDDKRNDLREESRVASISRYLLIRGDSFQKHHVDMIVDIFKSHDAFFEKYYGFNSNQIISTIQEIEKQILKNLRRQGESMSLLQEMHETFKEFVDKEGVDNFPTIEDCYNKFLALHIIQEKNIKLDEIRDAINKNPFEISPTANVPIQLLKLLSAHFGDNAAFVTFRPAPAWPTNDSIVYSNPLIKDNGKFYCFSYTMLFRNIGNILESWIQNKDNNYYQNYYQNKRAEYLENKALEYLKNILPTAQVYGELFYYIVENGLKKRVETDGLILYDENLFIVEAKAGELSTSARRGSLERMKSDMSKLIDSAYKQALRTKQYITDTVEPTFEYEDGSMAVVLSNKDKYKNIYLINVTLSNLAHHATRLNSLKSFDLLIEGKEWPWSVFINDLRVISELIEFPSEFLLLLQRRIKANDYPQFTTTDELDFLMFYFYEGLYFEDGIINNFDKYVPHAYTEKLDRYYDYLAGIVSDGPKPRLKISEEYKKLITEIESTGKDRFTKVTTTLLGLNSNSQRTILDNIKKTYEATKRDGKEHDFTMTFNGLKMGVTFSVSINRKPDFWNNIDRYCKLKMYQIKFEEWILITIDINDENTRSVDFKIYNEKWEFNSIMETELTNFKVRQLATLKKAGKNLGRNDPCPCNSGLKYKKCCGK